MGFLPACTTCCLVSLRSEESVMSGTRVTDSSELPSGFWESSPCPLEECQVPLTTKASLWPQEHSFYTGTLSAGEVS